MNMEKTRRIKIVGGPSPYNTKLIDVQTGEMIEHVISAEIKISTEESNIVTLVMKGVELDIEAEEKIEEPEDD